MNVVYLGTELKINVNIEPIGSVTMDSYNFDAEFYCSEKKSIVINKQEAIRVDSNNYLFLVDTTKLGTGDIKCRITAYIPDTDFEDKLRTEVQRLDTGITIEK